MEGAWLPSRGAPAQQAAHHPHRTREDAQADAPPQPAHDVDADEGEGYARQNKHPQREQQEVHLVHTSSCPAAQNFQNLALSSSVLIGLGIMRGEANFDNSQQEVIWAQDFNALTVYKKIGIVLDGLIYSCFCLALCCNMITLFLSTVTSMTGPGLALRGPEGSVSMAVMHMEVSWRGVLGLAVRGVGATGGSGVKEPATPLSHAPTFCRCRTSARCASLDADCAPSCSTSAS